MNMSRNFNYTKTESDKIVKQTYALLKKHNNLIKRSPDRILSEDDVRFIAGCKGNKSYGLQDTFSGKQLRKMEVILERNKAIKKKLVKPIQAIQAITPIPSPTPKPTRTLSGPEEALKKLIRDKKV